MVSNLSIGAMIFSLGVSVLTPVILVIYFCRKDRISLKAVLTGAAIWIVFSQILEKLLHLYVMKNTSIFSNPLALGIYGGLAAGVFEEVGRFVGFKAVLRNKMEWKDGIAYGIGHGGVEAIIIGCIAYIQYIMYSIMMNSGTIDKLNSKISPVSVAQLKQTLTATPWYMFSIGGIERIFAISIHIALSLVVLYGIKNRKNIYLLYAIILHALVDFPAGMAQAGGANVWIVELVAFIACIISIIFIVKSKNLYKSKPQQLGM